MFNTLPDDLQDRRVSRATFGQSLNTQSHLFLCLLARSAHYRVVSRNALKARYELLTYLLLLPVVG